MSIAAHLKPTPLSRRGPCHHPHRDRGIREKRRQAGEAESENLSIDRSAAEARAGGSGTRSQAQLTELRELKSLSVAGTRGTSKIAKPFGRKMVAEAKQGLGDGDYQRAADLAKDLRGEGAIIQIKALANIDLALAAKACAAATNKRPLSQQLNHLYAVLLMDVNRHEKAAESLRRALFLDDSLALVH